MRTPGATTFRRRSMSANTHSSLGSVIRKSPLNRACKPYKNDSRLERSEKRLLSTCYCTTLSNEREVRIRKIQQTTNCFILLLKKQFAAETNSRALHLKGQYCTVWNAQEPIRIRLVILHQFPM